MPGPRMLVIDDQEDVREALKDILEPRGFEVKSAPTGKDGINQIKERFFNIVILDIRLPDMTGIEVLEEIERLSPDSRVILMTAYASVETAVEAVKKKAFDYLPKPFRTDDLIASVEGALEHQRLSDENRKMLRQLKFLNTIAEGLISTLDLDSILKAILSETLSFLSLEAGAIYVREGEKWKLKEHKGVSSRFVHDYSELGNDHGIIRQAADFKAAVVGDEGQAETRHAWASVPLLYRDETYGVMVLVSKRPAALGEEERRTLTILGSQAGGAIYNALLYDGAEEMRRYLEGLIRDSADPIITYDLQGRARRWNEAASKLYGFRPEEALDEVLVEVPEDRREETLALFDKVSRGETIADLATVRRRKDGSLVHVAVTYSPIADSAGTVVGISSISRDLTLKRSIEEERIRTKVMEARGRIREVLVDVVPLILRRKIPEQDRNEFVSVLSLRLEEALYDDYLGKDTAVDDVTLGESISRVFNDMGGSFTAKASGDEIVITGTKCPWGNETKRNPVTCMLTKSISSRFAKRALGGVKVDLTMILANRDERCEIVIRRMREVPE